MADFLFDRFKYTWKGEWNAGTIYNKDDIVKVSGSSYVCVERHTANSIFKTDLQSSNPKWVVMTLSKSYKGSWLTGINYDVSDVVNFQGSLYICSISHTSTEFGVDAVGLNILSNGNSKWELFAVGQGYQNNWNSATSYGLGSVVKYNSILYQCTYPHISNVFEIETDNWKIYYEGKEYKGEWLSNTIYRKNDLVKFGGCIFKTILTKNSGIVFDDLQFEIEVLGETFNEVWNSSVQYGIGSIVRYGGNLYRSLTNNINEFPVNTNNWQLFSHAFKFKGIWNRSYNQTFNPGDVILRGGYLYKAVSDINFLLEDDYNNKNKWELLVPGKKWLQNWNDTGVYSLGDMIYYLGSCYVCTNEHISNNATFPGNGNGYNYWEFLIEATFSGLQKPGDLLTYGLLIDNSSVGPTRIQSGNQNQVLSINENLEIFWRNLSVNNQTIYVAKNGRDWPGYGLSQDKPFRTINYACMYVEDNINAGSLVKIFVATGTYFESGPISLPAGCIVMGDELRSTIIEVPEPMPNYINFVNQYLTGIQYLIGAISNVIINEEVAKFLDNPFDQWTNGVSTDSTTDLLIKAKLNDYIDYINSQLLSGNAPTLVGNNDLVDIVEILYAIENLENNKHFLAYQVYGYLKTIYGQLEYNVTDVTDNISYLIRGIVYDIKRTGNYSTLNSAKLLVNKSFSGNKSDLFYVRDTTGIRNLTVKGLEGSLTPPNTFIQYQRPTGGAYVSLDPGWGPTDNRTWIINRSPYIQGVTTIGTSCVGQKIDGLLHNGGNKSIVSNDFTQILSDGIGAWVLNDGRVELVSVFTYYCQIGYFAELGGIIRATNGNNSYGNFGAIAEGSSPFAQAIELRIDNTQNEAQVTSAIAGGVTDEIFIFEYTHAGEEYTNAIADILGAGSGINVKFSDFRFNALYEARLLDTESSQAGGAGYTLLQNSAQENVSLSTNGEILLNVNEKITLPNDVDGLRLIIVQGSGVGQYGYIDSFTPLGNPLGSNYTVVKKDSNDQIGWDHIVPGTTLQVPDSSSVYRIEPRIVANHPGVTYEVYNLPIARNIISGSFGGLSLFNTGKAIPLGTGTVTDATKIAAVFNINSKDTNYFIELVNGGAGYKIGETFTILGESLQGSTPENNIVITVTETTDDSTNSIAQYTFTGNARKGRYVTLAEPNFIIYSDDGEQWTESNTADVLDFRKVINGDNVFVAIANNTFNYNYSYNGIDWVTGNLPTTNNYVDIAFGYAQSTPRYVIISENSQQAVYSSNAIDWFTTTLPTVDQWQKIVYGHDIFLTISGSQTKDVAYSHDGITWSIYNNVLPAGNYNWTGLAFGNNRFIAISDAGDVVLSLDRGQTWTLGTSIPDPGLESGAVEWKELNFNQGVFVATCNTPNFVTTETGLTWNEQQINEPGQWFGLLSTTVQNKPEWVLFKQLSTVNSVVKIFTGAQAQLRANISGGSFKNIKIWNPGSGYNNRTIDLTITDNLFTSEVLIQKRFGNRVLAQPEFINRGSGYKISTSFITISGNGYADIIPTDQEITVKGVPLPLPGPGAQITVEGIPNPFTVDPEDLRIFIGVKNIDLGDDGSGNNTRIVKFTTSPSFKNEYNVYTGTKAYLKTSYSQCRISGHDFLDIGTGNFNDTNYPELYSRGQYFTSAPENEVIEIDGGRVFYTSTDQDGNFRTGELFSVSQATGIVTISAEFFDLDGLTELSLGGVRLGGSGTVVNEFSTDGTFSADSNNIVPTQKAIAFFIANRLSVGGSDLETNTLTAGQLTLGTLENKFVSGITIRVPRVAKFEGPAANVSGTIIQQILFLRNGYDISVQ